MKTVDLPWDIICIIMSNLPVKSLMRFQTVSKQWCNFIRDPTFRKSHSNKPFPQSSTCFMLFRKDVTVNELCLVDKQKQVWKKTAPITLHPRLIQGKTKFEIVSVCNGLLCLSIPAKQRKCGEPQSTYIFMIYNPITREGAKLPNLVIDEYVRAIMFGYDAKNDKYKVVVMGAFPMMHINTVGEELWRKLDYSQVLSFRDRDKPQTASSNENFFWFINGYSSKKILVLNISDEKFRGIELNEVPDSSVFMYWNYLTFIVISSRVQIWEFVNGTWREFVNGTWKRKKTYDKLFRQEVRVISVAGEDCLFLKLGNLHGDLVVYNPKKGKVSDLFSLDFNIYDVFSFVPTLVSLKFYTSLG